MKSSPEYITALHAVYAAEYTFGQYELAQGEDFVDETDPRCIELRAKVSAAEEHMIDVSILDYENAINDIAAAKQNRGIQ